MRRTGTALLLGLLMLTVSACGALTGGEDLTTTTIGIEDIPAALQATVTESGRDREPTTYDALWAQDGSYRFLSGDGQQGSSYDAEANVTRTFQAGSNAQTSFASEVTNAPPRLFGNGIRLYDPALMAWFAAERQGDAELETSQLGGRNVWRASTSVPEDQLAVDAPNRAEMSVDQDTGILLALTLFHDDESIYEATIVGDVQTVDRPANISVEPPAGITMDTVDEGYAVSSLADAPALVGYSVPTNSFENASGSEPRVWVKAGEGQPTGAEGSNPTTTGHVVVEWGTGWSKLYVNYRQTNGDPAAWSDPYGAEGSKMTSESVTVNDGIFAGAIAERVTGAGVLPHIWMVNDTLQVDIAGGLTTEDLLTAAVLN